MIRKYIKCAFVLFWLMMVMAPLHGQVKQSHSIVISLIQLKDGLNLGMVFNGIQLEYRYGLQWNVNDHEILYQPKLGFGVGFSRISGMECYQLHIAPINVTWTMPLYENYGHTIRVGANCITDYNYQLYEKLHDAPLFWTYEMGFSPVISYNYKWDNKMISVSLQNSLFGFTSHMQGYDPYFWQKTWKDFFVKPHEDMKFGSFNDYDHTNVSIVFVPNTDKIHSFIYEFDYFGLFYGNKFNRIYHNVLWRMSL